MSATMEVVRELNRAKSPVPKATLQQWVLLAGSYVSKARQVFPVGLSIEVPTNRWANLEARLVTDASQPNEAEIRKHLVMAAGELDASLDAAGYAAENGVSSEMLRKLRDTVDAIKGAVVKAGAGLSSGLKWGALGAAAWFFFFRKDTKKE